ncbi:hypothetical protein [Paraflavitalea speifideaquila]|uniref:hypothetical protein n=1 Tax=Paraflavitalea speifideaquila TaxID=3076558 RepID=UPI0028F103A4|nr:hypothetical protein [Paraflavitalea speifideiaquila]
MRNLIPMLVLIMSLPVIVLAQDGPVVDNVDLHSGGTILNAHDKELKQKWQACVDAKRYYDSVADPHQDLSKDSLRRRGLYTNILEKASDQIKKQRTFI